MKALFIRFTLLLCFLLFSFFLVAQQLSGRVFDKATKEPLTGATVIVEGASKGGTTDIDGKFRFPLSAGKYTVLVSYVSYKSLRIPNVSVSKNKQDSLIVQLESADVTLNNVQVVARRKTDTELSMIKSVRTSLQVVSGVSSQQIGKTLDRDASEVIKRVAGVSTQDNRFVVVRGLNQRYNNVWLNNAATPSSETDVKAFSFDAIPSNMIDNMMVYKSGSPEISAEATGGFIKITTKNIPDENFANIEYGVGHNSKATFRDIYLLKGSGSDYLGLGNHYRDIPSGVPDNLSSVDIPERDASALKFRNNWVAEKSTSLPNQKITISFGKKWLLKNNAKLGTISSLTYSNNYSVRENMENNAYEKIDETTSQPVYLYKYNANIYSNEFKLGLLHNWSLQNSLGSRIEFKNILNQIGVNKTSNTVGLNNYRQGEFKYFNNQYSSRTTYSGQISGNHQLDSEKTKKLEWISGFAYANRIEPDRQNWSMKKNPDNGQYEYMLPTVASINELGRLYMKNYEYVTTLAVNYEQPLKLGQLSTTLKAGVYNEYKTRNFKERSICYKATNSGMLSSDEINALNFNDLFTSSYLGQDKVIVVDEQTSLANTYKAKNLLSAAYFALNFPIGALNIYGGLRAEYNQLKLDGYYDAITPVAVPNNDIDFFPSLNTTYNLTQKTLVRLAYAHTINRPEFREVSPLSYYDFTEKYSVTGNPKLKNASIQNVDLRLEHYPSAAETFSIAAFYKHFNHPIEMVGTGSDFSFANAVSAKNFGAELEIKKSLDKWVKNFGLGLNASYIYSQVEFDNKETERNRPLQGQSPYVINASIFYQNDKSGLSSSLTYNVMGSRILVAAQLNQGDVAVPDIYEKERHVLDLVITKKVNKNLSLKLGIKDLLAQDYITYQKYEYISNGTTQKTTVNNKVSNQGRTWQFNIVWNL